MSGGPDLSLYEVTEVVSLVREGTHEDANTIFGALVDETLIDEIRVTVIATGFGKHTHAPDKLAPRCSPNDDGIPIEHLAEESVHALFDGCSNERNGDNCQR